MMKQAWYILNYHDISWEENPLVRGIGGSVPPDLFKSHLEALDQEFKLVSVQEGWKLYSENKIKEPLISFWFDDGFAGVRKYAFPLLEKNKIKAATSINSRFALRKEFFWRFKLSLLSHLDGMRFVKSKLRKIGYKKGTPVKRFTLDNYSEDVLSIIDEVYIDFTNESFRHDAYRLFDPMDRIKELLDKGWLVANHSAAHYPIAEDSGIHQFREQFEECQKDLAQFLNIDAQFWVIPFDRSGMRSAKLAKTFKEVGGQNRTMVLVGNLANGSFAAQGQVIHRIGVSQSEAKSLVRYIKKIPIFS